MIAGILAGGRPLTADSIPVSDPYWANVGLLVHFDGSGSAFVDQKGNTLTPVNATQSTAQKLFGSASLYATLSANAMIQTPTLSALNLSGQFTIDFSVMLSTTTQQYFVVARGSSTLSLNTASGKIQASVFGTVLNDPDAYSFGVWTRVRLTRDASNICRLFVNGILKATSSAVATNQTTSTIWEFGGSHFWGGATGGLRDGYMDEFRVTFGVCRSVASYALETAAFPDS